MSWCPLVSPSPEARNAGGGAQNPTAREVRELKARAAADLRTIGNYVGYLVAEDLKRKGRRWPPAVAAPGEKRKPYQISLYLTAGERKRLEAAAKAERRSVSGYVARVIATTLR